MKKTLKKSIHGADELKSLEALESENKKVVSSMKVRGKKDDENDKLVEKVRKSLDYKDETDPAKRRAMRRGK